MKPYTRTITVTVEGGTTVCVELPAPIEGKLVRLIATQFSGDAAGFAFTLLDRRGASTVAIDRNTSGGDLTSITEADGEGESQESVCQLTWENPVRLRVGDKIEVKGSSVSEYNTTHTVIRVVSSTSVITDVAYSADGSGGLWQVAPLYPPTASQLAHTLLAKQTIGSGQSYASAAGFSVVYQNRDNQDATSRRRSWYLYAELDVEGTGEKEIQFAYTIEVPHTN